MADSLDDLEREASQRQKRGGRGSGSRNPGEPRFPRGKGPEADEDAAARRRAELQRREEERERRRREAEQPPPPPAQEEVSPPGREPEEDRGEGSGGRRRRPKSMPFYPNPEHDEFLWRITEAASARQRRIPSTAVLRLALTRLQEQMTPSEIVEALRKAEQPEGKMGRPRL